MKIKEGYSIKDLPDEYIILPTQGNTNISESLLTVSETRTLLWNLLQKESTEDDLVNALISNHDINEAVARRDVKIFIRELVDSKLIINFP